jgi:hydrogenase expression/formation protein HypC
MCLGELAEVVRTSGDTADVTCNGRGTTVSLLVLDEPVVAGDWVVVHSGFALERITAAQAQDAAHIRGATGAEEDS